MAKEICGAKIKNGVCRKPAGAGTLHPGEGRCYLHGGNNQHDNSKVLILSADPEINERALEYLNDPDLLDLRRELAVLRARFERISRREDDSDAQILARLAAEIRNTAQAIQEIELARKNYLHISVTARIVSAFSSLVHKYLPDPLLRSRFAEELEVVLGEALRARHARVIAARAISPFDSSLTLPGGGVPEYESWTDFLVSKAEEG